MPRMEVRIEMELEWIVPSAELSLSAQSNKVS